MNQIGSLRLLIKSFITVVRDPTRTDKLFDVISDPRLANKDSYQIVINKLGENPRNLQMIRERYNRDWDLDELLKLPTDSMGYIYAKHMKDENLKVDYYQVLPGDTDHVYIQMRSRKTHDIWHTLTGFDTSYAGEVGLQAFSFTQYHTRLSIVIICMFLLHTSFYDPKSLPELIKATIAGFHMGQGCQPLFAEKFEENWHKNLDEYRQELKLQPFSA